MLGRRRFAAPFYLFSIRPTFVFFTCPTWTTGKKTHLTSGERMWAEGQVLVGEYL